MESYVCDPNDLVYAVKHTRSIVQVNAVKTVNEGRMYEKTQAE